MINQYYRDRRYLGSKDRRFISDILWFAIRNKLLLNKLAQNSEPKTKDRSGRIIIFAYRQLFDEPVEFRDDEPLAQHFHIDIPDYSTIENLSLKYSLPDYILSALRQYIPQDRLESVIKSLNEESDIHIRMNPLKTDIKRAPKSFEDPEKGRISPWAFRVKKRFHQNSIPAFVKGHFEIQDEGSQLISFLVNPEKHSLVIDVAAGGGGKTLHLSALMDNTGKVIATDKIYKRMDDLKERMERANAKNIKIRDMKSVMERFESQADYVLIDAPCSGTGTFRRHPDLKWRLNKPMIQGVLRAQAEMLERYSSLVKPSGFLIYTTCSLLPEENQQQISKFIRKHPNFKVQPALPELEKQGIRIKDNLDPYMMVLPDDFQTDGFFGARLKRTY